MALFVNLHADPNISRDSEQRVCEARKFREALHKAARTTNIYIYIYIVKREHAMKLMTSTGAPYLYLEHCSHPNKDRRYHQYSLNSPALLVQLPVNLYK